MKPILTFLLVFKTILVFSQTFTIPKLVPDGPVKTLEYSPKQGLLVSGDFRYFGYPAQNIAVVDTVEGNPKGSSFPLMTYYNRSEGDKEIVIDGKGGWYIANTSQYRGGSGLNEFYTRQQYIIYDSTNTVKVLDCIVHILPNNTVDSVFKINANTTTYRIVNASNVVFYKNTLYAWCDLADTQGIIFRKKLLGIDALTGNVVWDPNTTHRSDRATGGMTIIGNKLYMTGYINSINGNPVNRNTLCYNLDNRQTTNWNPLNNFNFNCNGCGPSSITSNKKNTIVIAAQTNSNFYSLIASDTLSGTVKWQKDFDSQYRVPLFTAEDSIGYCFVAYCCNIRKGEILRIRINDGQALKSISYPTSILSSQIEFDTTSYFIGEVKGVKLYGKHLYMYGFAQDGTTLRRNAVQIDTSHFRVTDWKPFNELENNETSGGSYRSVQNIVVQNGKVFMMGDFKLIKLRFAPQLALIDPNLGKLLWKPIVNHNTVNLYSPMATAFEGDSLIWIAHGNNNFVAFDARTGFLQRRFTVSGINFLKKIIATDGKLFLQGGIHSLNGLPVTSGFGTIDKDGNPFPWDPIFSIYSGQINQIQQYGDLLCIGGQFTTNKGGYNLAFINRHTGELTNWKPNIRENDHIRNFVIQGNEIIIDRDLNYISPPQPAEYRKINIPTGKIIAEYYYPNCLGAEKMIAKEKYVFLDTYCGSSSGQNVVYLDQEYKKIEINKKLLSSSSYKLSNRPIDSFSPPEPEDMAIAGNTLFYGFTVLESLAPMPFFMSTTFPKNFFNNSIDYFPQVGGNAGSVTVNFYGYDIAVGSSIKLLKTGQTPIIVPDSMLTFPESYRMQAILNLRNKAVGDWDIEITTPSGDKRVLANGFKIEEAIPADIHVEIVAPAQIRVGAPAKVKVYVANRGDFDAYHVPIWLTFPANLNVNLQIYTSSSTGRVLHDTLTRIPITKNNGELIGYGSWISIPRLKAGELIEVPLTIQSPGTDLININAYPAAPLSDIQISQGIPTQANTMTPLLANDFDPFDYGYPKLLGPSISCLDKLKDLALQALGFFNPIVGCGLAVKGAIESYNSGGPLDVAGSFSEAIWGCTGGQIARKYQVLKAVGDIIAKGNDLAGIVGAGRDALDECDKLKPNPKNGGFAPIQPVNIRSGDPNDKLGPVGAKTERFVTGKDPFSYLIRFENFDTATAAAQFVVLIDTLDKNKFNLKTFQLGYFNVADTTFYVPPGKKHHIVDWDMRPAQNLILRMEARFNDTTGVLKANYTSLDPKTMELTEDVFLGFLPPNQNPPEGEGGLAFSVKPKQDLPNLSNISNKAYIYFDYNEVVPTPPWSNKLDKGIPSSQIQSLLAISQDTTIMLRWGGSDNANESGVKFYDIMVSVNNHPYKPFLITTPLTSINFVGKIDSTYRFYSIAYDSVYNVEPAPVTFDAQTRIQLSGTVISVKSGDWNNSATWSCNCIPTASSNVLIKSGHSVKLTPAMGAQGSKNLTVEAGALFDAKGVFLADPKR